MFVELKNGNIRLDTRTSNYIEKHEYKKLKTYLNEVCYNMGGENLIGDSFLENGSITENFVSALVLNDPYTPIKFFKKQTDEWKKLSVSQAPIMFFYVRKKVNKETTKIYLDSFIKSSKNVNNDLHASFFKDFFKQTDYYHSEFEDQFIKNIKRYATIGSKEYSNLLKDKLFSREKIYDFVYLRRYIYPYLKKQENKDYIDELLVFEKLGGIL